METSSAAILTAASSHLSPTSSTLDIMSPDTNHGQPQFLKLEDLQRGSSSPSPVPDFDTATTITTASTQATPPPVIIHSKPAKKRKSWGQELPEPKTTLPPRKRAKTDDEKEQRRIERIKRNRAAAHNSRERKRQETETLAVLLARANAELDAYRRLHGPLPDSVVLPQVTLSTEDPQSEDMPSLSPSRGSVDHSAGSPASPTDSIFNHSMVKIKQEPSDLPPTFPLSAFESHDAKPTSLPSLDQTQHSAVMLCDLPCRSSRTGSDEASRQTILASNNPSSTSPASWWTNLFTYLLTIQMRTAYQQILLAIWTLSPSRMARLIQQASTARSTAAIRQQQRLRLSHSTTSSTTTRSLSPSTRSLAQLNAATGPVERKQECAPSALTTSSVSVVRTMRKSRQSPQPRATGTGRADLEEQQQERCMIMEDGNEKDRDPNDGVGCFGKS